MREGSWQSLPPGRIRGHSLQQPTAPRMPSASGGRCLGRAGAMGAGAPGWGYGWRMFSEMSVRAREISISQRPHLARSPRESMPTTLPLSTTGRRRICWPDMRRAAWRGSASGETAAGWRVMMVRTGTWDGSSPAATHRRMMSRSVTMPSRAPEPLHTGRAPTLCRASRRAARAALSPGSMDTTQGFMSCCTCKKITSFFRVVGRKVPPQTVWAGGGRFMPEKGTQPAAARAFFQKSQKVWPTVYANVPVAGVSPGRVRRDLTWQRKNGTGAACWSR